MPKGNGDARLECGAGPAPHGRDRTKCRKAMETGARAERIDLIVVGRDRTKCRKAMETTGNDRSCFHQVFVGTELNAERQWRLIAKPKLMPTVVW